MYHARAPIWLDGKVFKQVNNFSVALLNKKIKIKIKNKNKKLGRR